MSADKARQEARHDMYKNCNRSPCWKEQFRKRCLERLKDSRGRHLSSRRTVDNLLEADSDLNVKRKTDCDENDSAEEGRQGRIPLIDIILREEFDRLKGEVSSSKDSRAKAEGAFQQRDHLCDMQTFTDYYCKSTENQHRSTEVDDFDELEMVKKNCFNVNELVSWYEEIYAVLRAEMKETQDKQERLHLQEVCDDHVKHEEQELCSGLQALHTEEVICPICEKFDLMEYKSELLCRCGLRINIEQDSVTLKYVKDNLVAGTNEHSQRCESKPAFSLNQKFGISNLLMSCQDCDFLFVVV